MTDHRHPTPEDALPCRYRVLSAHAETADTVTLELTAVDRRPVPFRPGQFMMLTAFGYGEVPISISGDLAEPDLLVHTVRAVGPVTRAICAARPGDVLGVRGPYGTAWEVAAAAGRDLVFVAGGIGLAPLRPAILAAVAEPARYRKVAVVLGARRPAELLFADDLERWCKAEEVDFRLTVDRVGGPAARRRWRGAVGLVTGLLPPLFAECGYRPENTSAFVCGPEPMIRAVGADLTERGVPDAAIAVSLERTMRCGTATCGHCQLGPLLLCRDGAVVGFDRVRDLLAVREL